MSNIEEKINKAFDNGTANSELVHLNTKEADKFIDYIIDESVVLKQSRTVKMTNPIEKTAKINIGEDIWQPGVRGVAMDETKRVVANTSQIELVAQEIIAEVFIGDDELLDNIEGAKFTSHLMQMIAKRGTNQLETTGLYAKKLATLSEAVNINGKFDGMITRAENNGIVVDANDTGLFSDRYIERVKLTKLYKSFPTKYRKALNGLYVPDDLAIDYENLYNTNTTTAQGAENRNRFAKIPFTDTPLLEIERPVAVIGGLVTTMDAAGSAGDTVINLTSTTGLIVGSAIEIINADDGKSQSATVTAVTAGVSVTIDTPLVYAQDNGSTVNEVTLDGADILMTPKNNLVFGIYKNITIEKERQARLRGTLYVLTMRIDFQVENEETIGLIKNLQVR